MYSHGKFTVRKDGKKIVAEVLEVSRYGSKSPVSYYIRYENRLISPYEQRLRGWTVCNTINDLFRLRYGRVMRDLVYTGNPFLKLLKK